MHAHYFQALFLQLALTSESATSFPVFSLNSFSIEALIYLSNVSLIKKIYNLSAEINFCSFQTTEPKIVHRTNSKQGNDPLSDLLVV